MHKKEWPIVKSLSGKYFNKDYLPIFGILYWLKYKVLRFQPKMTTINNAIIKPTAIVNSN